MSRHTQNNCASRIFYTYTSTLHRRTNKNGNSTRNNNDFRTTHVAEIYVSSSRYLCVTCVHTMCFPIAFPIYTYEYMVMLYTRIVYSRPLTRKDLLIVVRMCTSYNHLCSITMSRPSRLYYRSYNMDVAPCTDFGKSIYTVHLWAALSAVWMYAVRYFYVKWTLYSYLSVNYMIIYINIFHGIARKKRLIFLFVEHKYFQKLKKIYQCSWFSYVMKPESDTDKKWTELKINIQFL